MKPHRIYVASSWRNNYQVAVVTALRGLGFEVYDYRQPAPGRSGFSWREISPGFLTWTPAEWRNALANPIAQEGFRIDAAALKWADCCVLVLPCGRSAHLEAGYMAGTGKPVYTLALEAVEPELMNLLLGPNWHICTTMNELFDRLEAPNEP